MKSTKMNGDNKYLFVRVFYNCKNVTFKVVVFMH